MIINPVIPGFNPDPCICKKGDDFYIAVSSFEWFPGVPVYHSKDMVNWELYTHILTDDREVDLKKLPSAKGIWAPCLTYCEEEGLFYLVYGVMNSMNARYFDVDNYVITARDIKGPWSKSIYLNSNGFDASLYHEKDGRKYLVCLDWEIRDTYEKPGQICLVEYSPQQKKIIGIPKRIYGGGTDRGCIEAPHITKHGEYYYLMCAEGGTGYNHCVTMARSKNIWGPYESDPCNPIVTSNPVSKNERSDWDHLKPRYYNKDSILQKSGHGSYVELDNGEIYLAHLTSRPFVPELRCTLGRETALQKMYWTEDNWLRMQDGSNLAKIEVKKPDLEPFEAKKLPVRDDFDDGVLGLCYYSPRIMPDNFVDLQSRKGYLRIRGQESIASLNKVSLVARKLMSLNVCITVKMDFTSEYYKHSAGLCIYYDNMNNIRLDKHYNEELKQQVISLIVLENGEKKEEVSSITPVENREIYLRLRVKDRITRFEWSYDGTDFSEFDLSYDTSKFSDEYCKYGEFTGTMAGIYVSDTLNHTKTADFDFFEYRDLTDL